MNMLARRILTIVSLIFGAAFLAQAQDVRDSIVYRQSAAMDSTLAGKNIFSLLSAEGGVTVRQSKNIQNAFAAHIAANPSRTSTGYRVRIFNDNKQTSRNDSETALARFKGMFPGVSAYRTYSNPFFRVTVGDFRTKSEAMQLLQQIKASFPTAFIVKETIGYPVVDRFHSYTVEKVEAE